MAINQKISPVGIDKPIDSFQSYLFSNISIAGMVNADNWESYPRIYLNPAVNGRKPEYYILDKEYKSVLYDDNFLLTSYFVVGEDRPLDDGIYTVDVSLILQADIQSLFPSITHRADEELIRVFQLASKHYDRDTFYITGVETGIENVYREFDTTQITFDDMSEQFVVRFNYEVTYEPKC